MNELAIHENTSLADWQLMREQAATLVKTGFLPAAIKTPEQAMAIMLTGRELGLPPMQSLRGINVIQGVPVMKPELMLALCIARIPGFKYRFGPCDDKSATFIASRPSMTEEYISTFTVEDAKRAGLLQKETYTKYLPNMLRWRAIGNALHVVAPDVLVGIYTPEEMGAVVDVDGNIVAAPEAVTVSTANGDTAGVEVIEDTTPANEIISAQWSRKIHAMAREAFGDGDDAREQFRSLKEKLLGHSGKTTELTRDEGDRLVDALQILIDERREAAT